VSERQNAHRCGQPGQQHGRRIPSLSSEHTLSTCCRRVSSFLTEIVQQIHSLRASGVMSSQAASAFASDASAFRRSDGRLCTTPPDIRMVLMELSRRLKNEASDTDYNSNSGIIRGFPAEIPQQTEIPMTDSIGSMPGADTKLAHRTRPHDGTSHFIRSRFVPTSTSSEIWITGPRLLYDCRALHRLIASTDARRLPKSDSASRSFFEQ